MSGWAGEPVGEQVCEQVGTWVGDVTQRKSTAFFLPCRCRPLSTSSALVKTGITRSFTTLGGGFSTHILAFFLHIFRLLLFLSLLLLLLLLLCALVAMLLVDFERHNHLHLLIPVFLLFSVLVFVIFMSFPLGLQDKHGFEGCKINCLRTI